MASALLAYAATGCKKHFQDDEFGYQGGNGSSSSSDTEVPILSNNSVLDSISDAVSKDTPDDYVFNTSTANKIVGKNTSVEVSGTGASASGSVATISQSGDYIVEGIIADGQIVVNLPDDDKGTVKIILSNAKISSSSGAALMVDNAKKVSVLIPDATESTLVSTVAKSSQDDEANIAAVHSKQDIFFSSGSAQSGKLAVQSKNTQAIKSTDGIVFHSGVYDIVAESNDGIQAKTYIRIDGGKYNVSAYQHALKTTSDKEDRGFVYIADGALDLKSTSPASDDGGNDGIHAVGSVQIKSGSIAISAMDDGISSSSHITIDGGTIKITKADKCIAAMGDITINGGDITLEPTALKLNSESGSGHGITSKKDDSGKRNGSVFINGGNVNVLASYEGIQGRTIVVNNGKVFVNSLDDALNASDGSSSTPGGGFGGRPGMPGQPTSTNSDCGLYFNGGFTMVTSQGDGIDSNGELIIKGGVVLVSQSGGGNEPIDAGDGYEPKITGGVVIAAGAAGMASAPSCTQTAFFTQATGSAGKVLAVNDSKGSNILAWKVPQAYQVLTVSAPELSGATYTICTDAKVSGSEYVEASGFYYPAQSASGSGTSINLTDGTCTGSAGGRR